MAHKVLSSDMGELINAMKMAQKYSTTTLDQEYRRGMLSAAHVLAVDAKHLFDVVDAARKQAAKSSSSAWRIDSSEEIVRARKLSEHKLLLQNFLGSLFLRRSGILMVLVDL